MNLFSLALLAFSLQGDVIENATVEVSLVMLDSTASTGVVQTAISPDGNLVAKGGVEGDIVVASVSGGTVVLQVSVPFSSAAWIGTPFEAWTDGNSGLVGGLQFSSASDALFVALGDGTVVRYDLATGAQNLSFSAPFPVTAMAINDAGTRLLLGSCLGEIEEYSIPATGSPQYVREFRAEDGAGLVFRLDYFDADAKVFSSLGEYRLLNDLENGLAQPGPFLNAGPTVWNAVSGVRLIRFAGPNGSVDMAESGGKYYLGSSQGGFMVHDSAGGVVGTNPIKGGAACAPLASAGWSAPVIATLRGTGVSLVGTGAGYPFLGAFRDKPFSPGTLSAVHGTNRIVVGTTEGEVVVYSVSRLTPTISSSLKSEALGQIGQYSISATQELSAHSTQVEEIAVSNSGDFAASRSADGKGVLWTRGANATYSGLELPIDFGGCWANQFVFNFDESESKLCSVDPSGALRVTDLASPALATTSLSVMNGSQTVYALSVMPAPNGEFVVAGNKCGVYRVSASGQVLATLVSPVAQGDIRTVPYTILMHAPNTTKFLAAPTSMFRKQPSSHKPTVFSFSNFEALGTLDGRYEAGQFACVGPSSFVLANGGDSRGAVFLNSNTLAKIAGSPIRSRSGVGCFQPGYALGLDGTRMNVVWLSGSTIQSSEFDLPWKSPVASVGSQAGGGVVLAGLESGQIHVIEAM